MGGVRDRLLVGTLGFLKAGCSLQGGGRRKRTRKSTVIPKQLQGGIRNFGDASSDEEAMELENGDKVPVTPTNSPRGREGGVSQNRGDPPQEKERKRRMRVTQHPRKDGYPCPQKKPRKSYELG